MAATITRLAGSAEARAKAFLIAVALAVVVVAALLLANIAGGTPDAASAPSTTSPGLQQVENCRPYQPC